MEINNKASKTGIIFSLACFITNLSQLPYFVENELTQILNYPIWIGLIIYAIFNARYKVNNRIFLFIFLGLIFLFGQIYTTIFYQNMDYIITSLSVPYYMSLVVMFVSYVITKKGLSNKDIILIFAAFVISSLIVAAGVLSNIISSDINFLGSAYAYASKNSISQILFTAFLIIFIYFIELNPNKSKRIFAIIFCLFLTIVLFLLKSRATLLGYVILSVYYLWFMDFKTKVKFVLSILGMLLITYIYGGSDIFQILLSSFIFAGRDVNDLNSLSSNRIDIISSFPYLIDGHEILGIGNIYFECFYLSAYLQHGIFGLVLIITAILPIYFGFKYFKNNDKLSVLLVVVALTYAVNGIFEGVAPFGPGSKCYFLWLLLGIFIGKFSIKPKFSNISSTNV